MNENEKQSGIDAFGWERMDVSGSTESDDAWDPARDKRPGRKKSSALRWWGGIMAVLLVLIWYNCTHATRYSDATVPKATPSATVTATAAPTERATEPTALPGSAKEAVENGTLTAAEIRDRAAALGWSTQAWQEWYYVASQTGTTMEAIEAAAQNINQQLQNSDPDFLASLEAIGISEEQAKAMTPEDLFDAVISSLQNLNNT